MATRWEVTRAVRGSDLPSPSRLIMLTLADVAEVGTAEIPAQFTPSLSVLADETGLGKSTVKVHLAALESDGWIIRSRPDARAQWNGERTRYRLATPRPGDGLPLGQEMAHPRPGDGPGVGQEPALGRPGAGHLETDHSDQELITTSSSAKPPKAAKPAPPPRPDVEQICNHLADHIAANGSKRPTITQKWRDEARRLIDLDGRTVEQIIRCIDWCQTDAFWKGVVLSMPKLREKYDQLRLAAQRDKRPATTPSQREYNGLVLNERTIADLERRQRFAALDAEIAGGNLTAIEGLAS